MEKKYFKIANKVKQLLIDMPELRDNDSHLIAQIWFEQTKNKNLSAKEFLSLYANNRLSSAESIRRSRQKLQESFPSLRGKRWEERHNKLALQVKEEIIHWGHF